VITIPGFGAAACLGRTAATATSSRRRPIDGADDAVRPAQGSRLEAILDALGGRSRGDMRYVVRAEVDCPPGERPTLVCVYSIPLIECEWTGRGTYRCRVKEWKCLPGGYEWQCQPVTLRVLGE
jgi:hypothetical protein